MTKETEVNAGESVGLTRLYESWFFVKLLQATLDELPPDYLHILNIARNILDGNPIPGVNIPENFMALVAREQGSLEKRYVTRRWQEKTTLPSDTVNIRPIESFEELPKVLPPALLFQAISPDLFTYKAIDHSLPIVDPQKPQAVTEEKSETLVTFVRQEGKELNPRQSVYVLLDVSISMGDASKLTFAKAIVLSYLVKAQEERAELYCRTFAWSVSPLVDCSDGSGFGPLALEILECGLRVDTNVGKALRVAINDIKGLNKVQDNKKAKTEILLVSDCDSFYDIPKIPPWATLHTLHLLGGGESYIQPNGESEEVEDSEKGYTNRRFQEIRKASKTFTTIDTSQLVLPKDIEEAWKIREELEKLEQEAEKVSNLEEVARDRAFQKRIEDLRRLSKVYKKMYGDDDLQYDTAKRAGKFSSKVSFEGIKQRILKKIKELQNLKNKVSKNLRKLRVPKKQDLEGTIFDFRIRPK